MEDELETRMEKLEMEVKNLKDVILEIGRVGVHNFQALEKSIDEKIKAATKEVINKIDSK